ncbi:MAG: pyridoxal-dependent decarboxylase, exosortase A system-associated [Allosphingosinicella sp.]
MSKPVGPIPAGFGAQEGMLTIAGRRADALVEQAGGTPLFVYDFATVRARVDCFRAFFPGVQLHYAIKANPYPSLLEAIAKWVDGLDIASAGEMAAALAAGAPPAAISFAGPGKSDDELAAAVAAGVTINLESEGEGSRALAAASRLGRAPRLAVRVNPDFELRGSGMRMGGGARPFGLDAALVPALARRLIEAGAEWRGFHIFAGSQALDAEALVEAQAATLALAGRLADETGAAPPLVNLGGGFGIPYFAGERPLDVERIGAALAASLEARPASLAGSAVAIELGRWLVGEAGVYLARILDRKESRGRIFLVVDGGMHHQLAASGNFGQVVRRNFPLAIASRFGAPPKEEASVVGRLCTPLDRLADEIMLPRAEVGDLVAIFLAGAYGLSASPQAFLGHPPAREILV